MKPLPSRIILAAVLSLASSAAFAGPFGDTEAALRGVYSQYRVALFATNSGNGPKSETAIAAFQSGWADVATTMTTAPQYQDDPALPDTIATVTAHAASAAQAVQSGNLPQAHEALEGIRSEIGALHSRNGIATFSDRMNDYHAAMEAVLATDPAKLDAAGRATLHEQVAVLSYLAGQIASHPAPEAADPAYAPLDTAFQASVSAMVMATRSADSAAISAALSALKPAYSKFFVQFG